MAYEEVKSLDADTTISLGGRNKKTGKANPTSAEGYYLGTRMVTSPKSKTGLAAIHFLQTPKGNLGVWGKTDMDRKISTVTPGSAVRIAFDKMVATPNGEMYKFKVQVDKDNTIDVSGLNDTNAASATSDDDTEEYNVDGSTEDEGDNTDTFEDDVPSNRNVAATSTDRKMAVEALLAKGRTASTNRR